MMMMVFVDNCQNEGSRFTNIHSSLHHKSADCRNTKQLNHFSSTYIQSTLMADDYERTTTSSAYPPPPSFYKHLTEDNVNRLKAIQEQHSQSQSQDRRQQHNVETQTESPTQQFPSPSALNTPSIPDDLAVLIPPKPPTSGSYTSFGDRWNVSCCFEESLCFNFCHHVSHRRNGVLTIFLAICRSQNNFQPSNNSTLNNSIQILRWILSLLHLNLWPRQHIPSIALKNYVA